MGKRDGGAFGTHGDVGEDSDYRFIMVDVFVRGGMYP